MSKGFNLVDARWIPCVTKNGGVEFQGVLDSLKQAHQFKEVRDESPLVTVALHRMLLAVLHRVFGPNTPDIWQELWRREQFDAAKLDDYLRVPHIHTRFDLFDEKHPFYQTVSLQRGETDKKTGREKFVKPIWQMAHELAYSDNMHIFSHFTEDAWETRPTAEAARWLVAFQAFALSGTITTEEGKKKQDGSADAAPLVKSAVVLAKGSNLFETLLLNLVQYTAEEEKPFAFRAEADMPAWERDEETKQSDRKYDGYLDLLTWQSRRVKLIPDRDADGRLLGVSGVVAMKGFQLPDGYWRHQRETMVGFFKVERAKPKDDPWPPLGFRLGKALWRNSHALFQSIADETERPLVLSWVDDLRQEGRLTQKQIQVEVCGLCSNQAKVYFWRHETLPLPLRYLHDALLFESLKKIVHLAEQVAAALSAAVWRAALTALKPGKEEKRLSKKERDAVERVVQSLGAEHLFWSRLEEPFRERLQDLPGDDAHRLKVIQQWFVKTLKPTARESYRRTAGEMEDSSRALRAAVSGEELLNRSLARIAAPLHFVLDTAQEETGNAATRS
jgi:CRISPR system Cascade subunit CasA